MFPHRPLPLAGSRIRKADFPLDNLPPQLAGILESTAAALGVPIELVVGPYFGVASTAQGRAVIRVNDAWAEPGPIHSITAASTGARKTPVLRAARDPLIAVQTELEREMRGEVAMAKAKLEVQADRVKALKTKLAKFSSSEASVPAGESDDDDVNLATVEAALRHEVEILEELQETLPAPPKLWFDDPTSERMHDLIAENPHSGIMIAEARDFLVKLLKGDVQLKSFLCGYSMETTSRDLVSRSVRTAHEPSMAAVLVTQTPFLRELLRDKMLRDAGFLDRYLVTWVERRLPPPITVLRADQLQSHGLKNTSEADQMWDRYIRWEVRRTFPLGRQTLTFGVGDDAGARRLDLHFRELAARMNDGGSAADLGHGSVLWKLGGQALRYARLFTQYQLDPPNYASPMVEFPKRLDPSQTYLLSERDIAGGFDVAWHSFTNLEDLVSQEFDDEEALETIAVAVLTVAKELLETDPEFDYVLNSRTIMRKRSKISAAACEMAFARLIETGWAVDVTAQIPRARKRHIMFRPDFLAWLLEYGYVETQDETADPHPDTTAA